MSIRIATYNIRHGLGDDDKLDLARVSSVVREIDADILFLQEVDRDAPRSGRVPQAQWLAGELGMSAAYEDNYQVDVLFGMGNAILCRSKIYSTWNRFLPYIGERRGLLIAKTIIGGAQVTLAATHWGVTPAERALQSQKTAELLSRIDGPLLVGGDLNAEPSAPETLALLESARLADMTSIAGPTYPAGAPKTKIDYLLARHFAAQRVEVRRSLASDHLPVVCDVVRIDGDERAGEGPEVAPTP